MPGQQPVTLRATGGRRVARSVACGARGCRCSTGQPGATADVPACTGGSDTFTSPGSSCSRRPPCSPAVMCRRRWSTWLTWTGRSTSTCGTWWTDARAGVDELFGALRGLSRRCPETWHRLDWLHSARDSRRRRTTCTRSVGPCSRSGTRRGSSRRSVTSSTPARSSTSGAAPAQLRRPLARRQCSRRSGFDWVEATTCRPRRPARGCATRSICTRRWPCCSCWRRSSSSRWRCGCCWCGWPS